MKLIFKKTLFTAFISTSVLLTACGGSSSSDPVADSTDTTQTAETTSAFTMVFAKADGSVLSSYNSETKSATNLNDNTELTLSNQTIGGLLFWQDGEDQKAVVLNTAGYSFAHQTTRPIDQPDLHYTLHYHNEELASHKPDAI